MTLERKPRYFLPAFRAYVVNAAQGVAGRARDIESRVRRWEAYEIPRVCLHTTQGGIPAPVDCQCSGCLDGRVFVYLNSVVEKFGDGREFLKIEGDREARIAFEKQFAEEGRKW